MKTPKIYPRKDKRYQSHTSLDFQYTKAKIFEAPRRATQTEKFDMWIIYAIVGVMTGASAFLIDFLVEELVVMKWQLS